jgi:hypothetical protein
MLLDEMNEKEQACYRALLSLGETQEEVYKKIKAMGITCNAEEMDSFDRCLIAQAVTKITGNEDFRVFYSDWIAEYGRPNTLLPDPVQTFIVAAMYGEYKDLTPGIK